MGMFPFLDLIFRNDWILPIVSLKPSSINRRRDRLPTLESLGFPDGSDSKESPCNAEDLGSIPGLGRSPGGGHGNPLQYFCLENPTDRGASRTIAMWSQRVGHTEWPSTAWRSINRIPLELGHCADEGKECLYLLFISAITGSIPWSGRPSWRWEWLPTSIFLPGEFHGQRSLAGYSLWGCKVEHDWATFTFCWVYFFKV